MKRLLFLFFFFQFFLFSEFYDLVINLKNEQNFYEKAIDRILTLYFVNNSGEFTRHSFLIKKDNQKKGFICRNVQDGTYDIEISINGLGVIFVKNYEVGQSKKELSITFPDYSSGIRGAVLFNKEKYFLEKARIEIFKKGKDFSNENRFPFQAQIFRDNKFEFLNLPHGKYLIELKAEIIAIEKKDNFSGKDIKSVNAGAVVDVKENQISIYDFSISDLMLEAENKH